MSMLQNHLDQGVTTLARCWAVYRSDGKTFGFTDHDQPLNFENVSFRADSGMTATTIASGAGLSVDNTEALGALSDSAITEADIEAGRFDGAEVKAWVVNWTDVVQRKLQFAGSIGELRRTGGAFHAELRGLTDRLNQPQGRVYQTSCPAILGDSSCRFDLDNEAYSTEVVVETFEENRKFQFVDLNDFEPGWFERGRLTVLSGEASGLIGVIKRDHLIEGVRYIEVWEGFRALIALGDSIRIEVGCDKRGATCRLKFNNFLNFRGFPDIPGDDWLSSTPNSRGENLGLSLRQER